MRDARKSVPPVIRQSPECIPTCENRRFGNPYLQTPASFPLESYRDMSLSGCQVQLESGDHRKKAGSLLETESKFANNKKNL